MVEAVGDGVRVDEVDILVVVDVVDLLDVADVADGLEVEDLAVVAEGLDVPDLADVLVEAGLDVLDETSLKVGALEAVELAYVDPADVLGALVGRGMR